MSNIKNLTKLIETIKRIRRIRTITSSVIIEPIVQSSNNTFLNESRFYNATSYDSGSEMY